MELSDSRLKEIDEGRSVADGHFIWIYQGGNLTVGEMRDKGPKRQRNGKAIGKRRTVMVLVFAVVGSC